MWCAVRRDLIPVLLVGISALVLHDSHTLRHPAQAVVVAACLGVMVTSMILQLRALLRARRRAGVPQP